MTLESSKLAIHVNYPRGQSPYLPSLVPVSLGSMVMETPCSRLGGLALKVPGVKCRWASGPVPGQTTALSLAGKATLGFEFQQWVLGKVLGAN